MAQFMNKVSIQTPVKNYRDFDLSSQHLTTAFFMKPYCTYAREFPAKSKIKCNLKSYTRLMPLLKPVMGSVQIHNRAFFVPFATVWSPFNAFITGAPYTVPEGVQIFQVVPRINLGILTNLLSQDTYSYRVTDAEAIQTGAYDFRSDVSSTPEYRNFNAYGRHIYSVLRSLGYTLANRRQNTIVSALPLLCFCRVFFDWYYPAQYAQSGPAAWVDGLFHRTYNYSLTQEELDNIFQFIAYTYYNNDYFTAAWDSPTAPNIGVGGNYDIPDISLLVNNEAALNVNNRSNGTAGVYSTPVSFGNPEAPFLTQYASDSLKALTNYMKRHQLVGGRVIDRYLSDFGVRLEREIINRSLYIGSDTLPIQFMDVTATASSTSGSEQTPLGELAGKGVGYSDKGNFVYDNDEFGMFIIVTDIAPDIAYYQGMNKQVMHVYQLDFYNGEFDKLGTQPVRKAELYFDELNGGSDLESIFGFLPRYAEYKVGRDVISGDFLLNSRNAALMPWSTARDIPRSQSAHNIGFMRGSDAWQYSRIFFGQFGEGYEDDKFILVHRINIKAAMPMSPLYDTYDFDEPEGDTIQMQANGSQFS